MPTSNLDRAKTWLSDGPYWTHEPTDDEAGEVARSLAALLGEVREEMLSDRVLRAIVGEVDYDIAKSLDPATAEDPDEVAETLAGMRAAAIREAGN